MLPPMLITSIPFSAIAGFLRLREASRYRCCCRVLNEAGRQDQDYVLRYCDHLKANVLERLPAHCKRPFKFTNEVTAEVMADVPDGEYVVQIPPFNNPTQYPHFRCTATGIVHVPPPQGPLVFIKTVAKQRPWGRSGEFECPFCYKRHKKISRGSASGGPLIIEVPPPRGRSKREKHDHGADPGWRVPHCFSYENQKFIFPQAFAEHQYYIWV